MWYSKRQKVKISYFLYTTGIKLNMLSNIDKITKLSLTRTIENNINGAVSIVLHCGHSLSTQLLIHPHLYRSWCQIHCHFLVLLLSTSMENRKVTVYYYIHVTQVYCGILEIYRVIACDENVIRNSEIARFVYRFDPPSRCNIVRLNSYRSFCFCLLDIFSLTEGAK